MKLLMDLKKSLKPGISMNSGRCQGLELSCQGPKLDNQ